MRRLPLLLLALLAVAACAWLLLGEPAPGGTEDGTAREGASPGGRGGPALHGASALRAGAAAEAVARARVTGVVLRDGAPEPGAPVTLRRVGRPLTDPGVGWENAFELLALARGGEGGRDDLRRTTTDAQGAFAFEDLPLAREPASWAAECVRDGLVARGVAQVRAPGECAHLRLQLEDVQALAGSVETAEGAPLVADVRAVAPLVAQATGASVAASATSGALVRCDEAGRFTLHGLTTGWWAVEARLPGGDVLRGPAVELPFTGTYRLVAPALARRVTGRCVRAPGGAPVPGAALALTRVAERGDTAWLRVLRADAAGRFETPAPAEPLVLLAETPGLLAVTQQVPSWSDEVLVHLLEGARITGRVRAKADGAPCPGARVRLAVHETGPLPASAVAGTDGAFTLEPVRPGQRTLWVLGGGWASPGLFASAEGAPEDGLALEVAAGATTTYDLLAVPTLALPGRVLDAAGRPVAGAHVRATLQTSTWMGDNLEDGLLEAASDAEGRFQVADLVAGARVRLMVTPPGGVPHAGETVTVSAGMAPVEVRLPALRGLRVTVLGADDGQPVARTVVRCRVQRDGDDVVNVTEPTDAAGRAFFPALPEGTTRVRAGGGDVPRTPYEEVDAQPGAEPRTHTLRAARGLTITGRVLDAERKPAAGVGVGARDAEGSWRGSTTSAPDGSFRLRGLPAGRYQVRPWGEGVIDHEGVPAEAGARDVEVLVERPKQGGATLRVRVTGPDGQPVPLVSATLSTRNASTSSEGQGGLVVLGLGEGDDAVHTVGLARGDLRLAVYGARGPDGLPLDLAPHVLPVTSLDPPEIAVRLEPGRVLRGRVLLPDGRPLRGVLVEAEPEEPESHDEDRLHVGGGSTYSDAEGRFRFVGLAPRSHRVTAYTPRGYAAPRTPAVASPGGEEVVLRLATAPTVRVVVLDPQGRPLEGSRVLVQADEDASGEVREWHDAYADEQGVAEVERLDPQRTYHLEVSAGDDDLGLTPLVRDAWRPADLEVRLAAGRVLTGLVRDAQGRPVAGASVRIQAGEHVRDVETDDDGRFTARGLPAGPLTVWASDSLSLERGGPGPGAQTLEPGRAEVLLTVARAVETRLRCPDELPAKGEVEAHLLRHSDQHGWGQATTLGVHRARGEVVVRRLPDDETRLAVALEVEGAEPRLYHLELPAPSAAGGPSATLTLRRVPVRDVRCQVEGLPRGETAWVQARHPLGIVRGQQTDARGQCLLRGVPDGTVTFGARCQVDGGPNYEGQVTSGTGGSVTIPLALQRDDER